MGDLDGQVGAVSRDELVQQAGRVLGEVEQASLRLSARADHWLGTLRQVHLSAYRGDPDSEHPVVDIELLGLYRTMFDQMATFAMLVDPYALDLRDQDTI